MSFERRPVWGSVVKNRELRPLQRFQVASVEIVLQAKIGFDLTEEAFFSSSDRAQLGFGYRNERP